jgi:hypothetical protein
VPAIDFPVNAVRCVIAWRCASKDRRLAPRCDIAHRVRVFRVSPAAGRPARHGSTGVFWMFQISSAYCLMVRSEEKMPPRATLMMHFFAQPSASW